MPPESIVPNFHEWHSHPTDRASFPAGSSFAWCRRVGFLRWAGLLGVVGSGVISCSGDTTISQPLSSPAVSFWALLVNQSALNLALTPPVDTFRLTATPVNANGVPFTGAGLTGFGHVTYTAADSTVTVDSTGLVTARFVTQPGAPTQVVVSMLDTLQMVIHTATVSIQVTATVPPALATFSLQPVAGDSAKRAVDFGPFQWPVRATDITGATVCDASQCELLVTYSSSNQDVVNQDPTLGTFDHLNPIDTGHVVITATSWAYGISLRDSVVFTIGYRLFYQYQSLSLSTIHGVSTVSFNAPPQLILGVGAVVEFIAGSFPQPVNVIFSDSTAVDSVANAPCPTWSRNGNIPSIGGDASNLCNDLIRRTLSAPGNYNFYSTTFPSDTGHITVMHD